jgi:hypothetical protein
MASTDDDGDDGEGEIGSINSSVTIQVIENMLKFAKVLILKKMRMQ